MCFGDWFGVEVDEEDIKVFRSARFSQNSVDDEVVGWNWNWKRQNLTILHIAEAREGSDSLSYEAQAVIYPICIENLQQY